MKPNLALVQVRRKIDEGRSERSGNSRNAGADHVEVEGGVKQSQQISLQAGWNAVYLAVTPDETPDELFRDWPVEWVARYDPAAFLEPTV